MGLNGGDREVNGIEIELYSVIYWLEVNIEET